MTINVHYSISELPQTSYRPRLADDRVGYFVTVLKDFSKKESDDDRFVRYINRWNLEKADPSADMSTPKEPIVFWLEKTIPFKYRKPIRDGILEWNKAFAKAGFYDAIEVRQQPDDAPWDPGDIRYNTFRWITAEAGFAMGPSRVNPTTGQILDADIIFDADFLQFWKQEYETFTPASVAALTGGAIDLEDYRAEMKKMPAYMHEIARRALHVQHAGRHVAAIGDGRLGDGRAEAERCRHGEAHHAGPQGSDDARSRPHARPAAQLQGQHVVLARGHERHGEDARRPASPPR